MTELFTAWLTTDPVALDQGRADVSVLRDELRGDDPTDPRARFSVGDPLFYGMTQVDAKTGDDDEARAEAVELLRSAGWMLAGSWQACPTGYVIPVTR